MPLLEVRNVSKTYGSFQALKSVSLSVESGDILAIIGPNGAGKTTLFRVMTGEVACDSGSVTAAGQDITHMSADQRVLLGIGRTFQVARVFPEHTAAYNVIVAIEARERARNHWLSSLLRVTPEIKVRREARDLLNAVSLDFARDVEARHLSLGDRKRLELALTLALDPEILMLDEPTAGMSAHDRLGILELISRIRRELQLTIVLTEHNMDFVFRLADRMMVMNQGEAIASGSPGEIRNNPTVQEIYLGKEMAGA